MILNTLKLQNFKNYENLQLQFTPGINCVVGKNGAGKTNLIDAIHYLSMTRSALNASDTQNIRNDAPFFAINGVLDQQGEPSKVNVYYERGKKKLMKVDGQEIGKLSDHIGTIPSVLTTPDDNLIIKEGSEVRRKLFDSAISQFNKEYLIHLINYQKILKQRNSLLKSVETGQKVDKTLLRVYNEKLQPLNRAISKERQAFITKFVEAFKENYKLIFHGDEAPGINYLTHCLDEDFETKFEKAIEKDVILQRTTMGAHRDDYEFLLNDRPAKKFGSQGQQKSFLLALKLAEYDYLRQRKGFNPLLLLDDIFDKLDDERIEHLVTLLSDKERFSQIFITDARDERSRAFFKDNKQVNFIEIQDGQIK